MEFEEKNPSILVGNAMRTKGMSVEKLAQVTGISDRFIQSIVDEDLKKLPSSPYVHGYILKIADALGLDGEELWKEFFAQNKEIKRSGALDELPGNRFVLKSINKKWVVGIVILIVVAGFVFWRAQSHFGEPELSLENFKDEMIVEDKIFPLKGKIDPRDQLFINEETIYPNEEGLFEKTLSLEHGFNTITFKIKKFLGEEYIIKKQIFLKVATSSEENANTPIPSVFEEIQTNN